VRRPQGQFPDRTHLLIGGALAFVTVAVGSMTWLSLFEEGSPAVLRRGYFASQLGKYIPGAIWQPIALVSSGARSGAGRGATAARFPVHVLTQAAAGGTTGALLVAVNAPGPARALAPLGLLLVPLLNRRWMGWFMDRAGRYTKRAVSADLLPSQSHIWASYGWGIVTLLIGGASFAVLLSSLPTSPTAMLAVFGYALAWTVGFLAIPFPSGVGIREAVLVGVIASASTGDVVAAAVAARLVTMGAEALLAASFMLVRRNAAAA
jgi:hypothetical protein